MSKAISFKWTSGRFALIGSQWAGALIVCFLLTACSQTKYHDRSPGFNESTIRSRGLIIGAVTSGTDAQIHNKQFEAKQFAEVVSEIHPELNTVRLIDHIDTRDYGLFLDIQNAYQSTGYLVPEDLSDISYLLGNRDSYVLFARLERESLNQDQSTVTTENVKTTTYSSYRSVTLSFNIYDANAEYRVWSGTITEDESISGYPVTALPPEQATVLRRVYELFARDLLAPS